MDKQQYDQKKSQIEQIYAAFQQQLATLMDRYRSLIGQLATKRQADQTEEIRKRIEGIKE
ncbi:MAG TPA: hypothetical protein VHQ86_04890 [Candidatus Saccharimonadia bacterium]|jgi:hypothetical protein|nr:hypothetical protein [Candidatus Saccharimonadia bacterium]